MSCNHSLPNQNGPFAEVVESYYLETTDGLFFAVKGLEHPPDRRIAVLRYAHDAAGGDRRKGGKSFRRLYRFDEQERFIQSNCPQYIAFDPVFQTSLQSVPISMVHKMYDPRIRFRELAETAASSEIERDAVAFLCLLQNEAQVPSSALGITGSLLIGLHTEKSDLDAVVFGTENCRKVYQALGRMLDAPLNPDVRRLDAQGMKELFAQRTADTPMDYDEFLELEKRKVNQGLFRKRTYFIRFVREAHEAGGDDRHLRYTPRGRALIIASIGDDREAIFTPCRYPLSNVCVLQGPQLSDLKEIVSFRGRFCEQARTGDTVRASGTLERIDSICGNTRHRLLLGNSREDIMGILMP